MVFPVPRFFVAPARLTIALAVSAVILAVAPAAEAGGGRPGAAVGDGWARALAPGLSARELSVPPGSTPRKLARAALRHEAGRLGLGGSLRTVRFDRSVRIARSVRALRFRQTAAGLRILWSQIDVTIARGKVSTIDATVVAAKPRLATGKGRVSRARARRIAQRAAPAAAARVRPLRAAYAGNPSTARNPRWRRPRLVWVVELEPPAAAGDDVAGGLCIVVDGHSGRIIARWPGLADRPDGGPDARGGEPSPSAVAAAGSTQRPLEISDATAGLPGSAYARFETTGDARVNSNWPSYVEARIKPAVPGADAASANAANVARTICNVRGYCGRDGGFHNRTPTFPGSVFPWIVHANYPGGTSRARPDFQIELSHIDVMGVGGDPNQPANDVIAHEFGHVMDWVYAGDRTFEGDIREEEAVQEALADMFAYEYDRFDATIAEETQRAHPVRDLANPGSLTDVGGTPFPAHMRDYDSTPSSAHHNSTILSHGYYLFVQAVGHHKAGRVLHNVPATLSPKPTFKEVARGFVARAGEIYPQDGPDPGSRSDIREAAETAFDRIGISIRDHRGEQPG